MMQSSEVEEARQALRAQLAKEQASGEPVDEAWAEDLPSDPLPEAEDDTSVTFIDKK